MKKPMEPEYKPSPVVAAEPIPEWEPALQTWQWAWGLHWIGFGALFTVLTVYCLITLILFCGTKTKRGHLAVTITSILFILGITRALFLFINPYESEQCKLLSSCPVMLSRILFGIALPCMTASFSLVHLTFLQVMKLKLYPRILQNTKFLSCIITVHFSLAIFADVILSLYADMITVTIVCQAFFVIFSLFLSCSFIYSGTKIVSYVSRNHTQVSRLGTRNYNEQRKANESKERKSRGPRRYRPNITKLVKITYITVFLGFASCALQLYSIFGIHKMFKINEMSYPKPWPWLIFQSLYRAVEFAAACTLAYVSRRQVSTSRHPLMRCFLCCPDKSRGFGTSLTYTSSKTQSSALKSAANFELSPRLPTKLGDFLA